MRFLLLKNTLFLLVLAIASCGSSTKGEDRRTDDDLNTVDTISITPDQLRTDPVVAAKRIDQYVHLLADKHIGIVANQTSVFDGTLIRGVIEENSDPSHLVDVLNSFEEFVVSKVFAPEHGFRGTADAGEVVKDGIDTKTGLPIISLYGKNKKPTPEQLEDIDIMIFDIQDVGARFYTYISTLHYVMEACAENNIPLIVLDRPNPNGHYIDGPILETEHQSFVGMHPVPVVHGMTIGEYARMINGEGWLKDGIQCDLNVIPVMRYKRDYKYSLPVRPSPNLPNDVSINLYPSLCFFEGTPVSAGRGTEMQFQVFGAPELPGTEYSFQFTPGPNEGAKYPKFDGQLCNGLDLRDHDRLDQLNLEWLISAYNAYPDKSKFFNAFFTKLAGTTELQSQIEEGLTADEIRESWEDGLEAFDKMRQAYLLYD